MKLIDKELLDALSKKAGESVRLRMNYNFHDSLDAPCQRLLNALEPGTIVPIHRHRHTSETYVLVRGKIKITFYDDHKNPTETKEICHEDDVYGIHIPAGTWHSLESLSSGTVIFEIKDGPYCPIGPDDMLA